MKNSMFLNERQMNESAPALSGADLLHLDGQCFTSTSGVLGVTLKPHTLSSIRRKGNATHWLIPVSNAELVAAAASLPGEVFWLFHKTPEQLLGKLADNPRGAWFDGNQIVINLHGNPKRVQMERKPNAAFAMEYLARNVVNEWTQSEAIQNLLPYLNIPKSQQFATA
jgi:hypothetical protein